MSICTLVRQTSRHPYTWSTALDLADSLFCQMFYKSTNSVIPNNCLVVFFAGP